MSIITLSAIKQDLRVTHAADDTLIQTLLDAAEDEAAQFLNLDVGGLPYGDSELAPSLFAAIALLVKSKYDAESADEIAKLRRCAETLMMPYREGLGM